MEINILITILLLCFLSFFDIIIFNEEILLTLCFLSFLFYCFNTLSEQIFSVFESRAAKFEQELLASFNIIKLSLVNDFNIRLKSQSFILQFTIVMSCLIQYLTEFSTFTKSC
jgi:hypothetical protein